MTRAELIAELAACSPNLQQADVELIVTTLFEQTPTRWRAAAASN